MTLFDAATRNYRVAFLVMVLRFVVPPLVLAALISRYVLRWHPILIYTSAIPVYWTIRVRYDTFQKKRAAARRGAVLAPEVKGKWIGNIDLIFKMGKIIKTSYAASEIGSLFDAVGEDCNTINFRILWQDTILTRDHRIMQQVLATSFPKFEKGVTVKLKLFDMFGDGIFNADGAQWKAHRAMTRPFFARERVADFESFDKYSNKVVDRLKQRAEAEESVDLQDIFARFTMDAGAAFLFGVADLNTLDLPLPRPGLSRMGPKGSAPEGAGFGSFVNAFEALQVVIPPRGPRGNLWPLWELFNNVATDSNRAIDDYIGPIVRNALDSKLMRGEKKIGHEEGSLLDHLADMTDDIQIIRDELINILVASRDTTAALLTFLFYLLCLHPEVLNKLRDEIIELVPSSAPTYDDVRKLKYLRACLNETLRLFPPVPSNTRSSAVETVLHTSDVNPDGTQKIIYMPGSGVPLRYSPMLMQRRKDLWGEDSLEFVPERWIDPKRVQEMTADPFKFIPFNAGPRICLGQNFAYNEASFLVVRILQTFDTLELRQELDAPEGSKPPNKWRSMGGRHAVERIWPRAALTMFSKGGVWIRMKAATA